MKTLYACIIALAITLSAGFTNSLQAQNKFIKPGAQWSYLFNNFFMPPVILVTNVYLRDTVINSDTINILQTTYTNKNDNSCSQALYSYIKQKRDTIYFKNNMTNGTYQVLYNFATPAGQSWTTTVFPTIGPPVTYTVQVDTIKTVTINSIPLRQRAVRYSGGTLVPETTYVTERIGCHMFMFNYYTKDCATDQPWFKEYLCYKDSTIGVHQMGSKPCNYTTTLSTIEQAFNAPVLNIFPNPANTSITVDLENNSTSASVISVFNSVGQLVLQSNVTLTTQNIDVSELPEGIYVLQINTTGLPAQQRKFCVDR